MKLDDPPQPKTLQKLASSSNGLVTYDRLMNICGYAPSTESSYINAVLEFMDNDSKLIICDALKKLLNRIIRYR